MKLSQTLEPAKYIVKFCKITRGVKFSYFLLWLKKIMKLNLCLQLVKEKLKKAFKDFSGI